MNLKALAAPLWIASLIVSVSVLWWAGQGTLALPAINETQQWIAETDTAIVFMSLARAIAYVVACYLFACSGLALLARLSSSPLLAGVADAISLPSIMRVNRRIIELSVVGALAVPSTAAASVPVTTDNDVPTLRNITPPTAPTPTPVAAPPVQIDVEETRTVGKGENLWVIAESVLFERTGEAPSESDLTAYWLRLIEANRSTLIDPENPDLIFAGQTVSLPYD